MIMVDSSQPALNPKSSRATADPASLDVADVRAVSSQATSSSSSRAAESYPLGISSPSLDVDDLPSPEKVFKARRIGWEELILLILGPGVIALGVSIGGGDWLNAPLIISQYGFRGIAWVILISVILQVFYNVELGRYTLATGETPLVGFGRAWPGRWLWIPLALTALCVAFIFGSWSIDTGASLFAVVTGRIYLPEELIWVRILSIVLMLSVVIILSFGRKLERTMEAIQGILLPYILIGLVFVCITVVPFAYWIEAISGLLLPAVPPANSNVTLLGNLAGFTALFSGLNFMIISYYRDKGFGMGSNMGYLTGLFSRRLSKMRTFGVIFRESDQNTRHWKDWFRYLLVDQWVIFFIGAILGTLLPAMLVSYLARTNPAIPLDSSNILMYAALRLREQFGALLSGWVLLTGFAIMFTTQLVILDLLARNLTEGLFALSRPLRQTCREDPRKIYYPSLVLLLVAISVLTFTDVPEVLTLISANLANFAALIFPLLMIYLNLKLPRPARITWWSGLVLVANTIFFGFFFINFLYVQITGTPLISW